LDSGFQAKVTLWLARAGAQNEIHKVATPKAMIHALEVNFRLFSWYIFEQLSYPVF